MTAGSARTLRRGEWAYDDIRTVVGGYGGSERRGGSGMTPASVAAANGRLDVLKLLQGWGGDLRKKTTNGASNLHQAARGGHTETLAFLLTVDDDVDAADAHGCTALHDARGSCALTIDAGADVHKATTAQQRRRSTRPRGATTSRR